MKRVIFFLLLLLMGSIACIGQSRYWVGASGGTWSNGANWSLTSGGGGGAGAPTSVQDAVFDNAFTGTVSYDAGTITINSLSVISSSTVTLSLAGATGRIITCNNGGAVTNAFFVESSSTLTMTTTTNSINFTLAFASTSKGQIDGTFITAGAVPGGSGGLIDATSSLITINGTCRLNSGSSNYNSNTALNTFFNAGSVFEINKNGGSVPTATWNVTSKVTVLGSNPDPPTFLGTSYGNLEVNAPLLGKPLYFNANISFNNINLINTGADVVRAKTGTSAVTYTLTINGNLTVSSSSFLETSGNTTTSGNPGIIIAKGNIINNGVIRENSTVTGNQFSLQGTSNQNISGTGTYTGNDFDFIINNSSGATLLSAVTLPYRYTITSGNLTLGNNNLTTPAINQVGSPTATTNHVVTNSSGKLVINNIGATSVIFPIGASTTSINQLEIYNGNNINYGARVEVGISPSIRFPIAAVNRTWIVSTSADPGGAVNVNFYYATGDGNALFNYAPATVEQGFYTGVWNVINTGLTQMGGPTNFQVNTTVSIFGLNASAPMVIGNIPSILKGNNFVTLHAQKQNEKIILNWTANNISTIERFIAERSVDGRSYSVLMELPATGFDFTDMQPLPDLNYYRIKLIEKDGKITYSNIAVILNAAKGFDLISITPNPIVNGIFKLNVSAAQKIQMDIVITDMQGRQVQKQTLNMIAGFNAINMNVNNLAAGTYQVYGNTADGRSRMIRFVIQ